MAGKRPARRVTSTDVARETGLSRATVSFVLNDTPNQSIPQATRERVLQAAARLGYTPYAPARTLRSGRSDVVVLVLPGWPQGPAMTEFVDRAAGVLTGAGLTLVTHVHSGDPGMLANLWAALTPAAVFGMRPFTSEEAEGMRRAGVTAVLPPPQSPPGHDLGSSLWVRGIGRVQAEHLIAKGHTRLAYALPDDPRLTDLGRGRAEGAARACADARLSPPVVSAVPADTSAAAEVLTAWRALPAPPTAVCAFNDEVALALLSGMRTLGLDAPADLAVVGADDILAARFAVPSLTTVAIDSGDLGARIAHALLRILDGDPADPAAFPGVGPIPLPESVHVIERDSA
ncbi:DNA-binding LacI/PurR family transcriptional regulator [Streptosporangium becharense]|uniref:DNA-binding LacI/PurR family transcriptional regulator n=1 Tax=Streptosporangium becharense TaxID=1816182 RepID=A0A7W9ILM0_9ACTN|nr:LacI family DNA-binding transcriptional regulator [Streptosporangium becharense]MBB2910266.1 DNA-binding LacI/PurR family transcriptional regulator [Streptosporangium becharense]MBB5823009.1 DNA-binding LacI/PurR family transcriptional regulator [Streptosporangium becharense]